MKSTHLIVTGSGRSGTRWLSRSLTAAGVTCGHESVYGVERFERGVALDDRLWRAEASWLVPMARYIPDDAYIVHVHRHPLEVIGSRLGRVGTESFARHWSIVTRHFPDLGRTDALTALATMWVEWIGLLAPIAHEMRALSDVYPETVRRWASRVNPDAVAVAVPRDQNRAEGTLVQRVTWSQVEHVPGLIQVARQLGYE